MLAIIDAAMKGAVLAIGAYSAALLRVAFGSVIAVPVWLAARPRRPGRRALRLHLERGAVSGVMALAFFYAIGRLPLAEVIAISFVAPLIALYLANVLLRERIGRRAIVGSVAGLAGTLIVIAGQASRAGPLPEGYWSGLAAIMFSALLYAYNFIIIRRQSQAAPPLEIAAFHSGVQVVVLAAFAPWFFAAPTPSALIATAGSGALTVAGALLLAWAYARADTQALVPMEYSGFLWAALLGWLFFAEPVTLATVAGAALIVAGCLYAARRQAAPALPIGPMKRR